MAKKHKRSARIPGGYVAVPKLIMKEPAWRAMTPGARLLWIELRGWLRIDGRNNGQVFLVDRDAAKTIGAHPGSIVRWYAENQHYGFLVKTAHGFLGVNGHGIGDHYRFTDLAHGTHPPTRDFKQWDGQKFVYTPRRPRHRPKQNPVRKMRTRRSQNAHIQKSGNGGVVCSQNAHIDEPISCSQNANVTSLPSPTAKLRQGSSTARAPVRRAGGAGSSPVPAATPVHKGRRQ